MLLKKQQGKNCKQNGQALYTQKCTLVARFLTSFVSTCGKSDYYLVTIITKSSILDVTAVLDPPLNSYSEKSGELTDHSNHDFRHLRTSC